MVTTSTMSRMPKLWSETIAEHRDAVRDAVLDAAAALVGERGLTGVTMSGIAQTSGIGRATLYKYFPDVDSVLLAWHERQVVGHLRELVEVGARVGDGERLEAVLRAYAQRTRRERGHGDGGVAAALHRAEHVGRGHAHLEHFLSTLIEDAMGRGEVRGDVPAAELAAYCRNALNGAGSLTSKVAVERLVAVVMAGLRP